MVVVPVPSRSVGRHVPLERARELLLIDPQPLFLAALSTLLAAPPLGAQVHVTADSSDLERMLAAGGLDLVLCDLDAEPIPTAEVAALLERLSPGTPMIVLGDRGEEASLLAALSWPVAGAFSKASSFDEFLVGVQTVLAGHRAIGEGLLGMLLARQAEGTSQSGGNPAVHLSPTELDILARVGQAQSIAAIAATRGISHKTVRNHLTNISRKLQLRGRTEVMLCAARMGLTGPVGLA